MSDPKSESGSEVEPEAWCVEFEPNSASWYICKGQHGEPVFDHPFDSPRLPDQIARIHNRSVAAQVKQPRINIEVILEGITFAAHELQRVAPKSYAITVLDDVRQMLLGDGPEPQGELAREDSAAVKVIEAWERNCGRVFEAMGQDNPRVVAIDAAILELRAKRSGPPASVQRLTQGIKTKTKIYGTKH